MRLNQHWNSFFVVEQVSNKVFPLISLGLKPLLKKQYFFKRFGTLLVDIVNEKIIWQDFDKCFEKKTRNKLKCTMFVIYANSLRFTDN